MSGRSTTEKQCVTCAQDRTKRNFLCDGCQQSYCSAHSAEHREKLNEQLTHLIDDYQRLEKTVEEPSVDYQNLSKRIDEWEKESMEKIQRAADRARRTLEDFVSTSKQRLQKSSHSLGTDLQQARQSALFSEKNLKEWKRNLKRLERQLNQRSTIKVIEETEPAIHLIEMKIPEIDFRSESPAPISRYLINRNERFVETLGPVDIEEKGLVVIHNSETDQYGYIRGRARYGTGCHAVRFRIEQFQKPYALFFGCVSVNVKLSEGIFKSDAAVGWFSCTQAYRHGCCRHNSQQHKYNGDRFERGDVLTLVFDRELNEIQLINRRINMVSVLAVGDELKYHEWQVLVVLTYPGDSVRLLT